MLMLRTHRINSSYPLPEFGVLYSPDIVAFRGSGTHISSDMCIPKT